MFLNSFLKRSLTLNACGKFGKEFGPKNSYYEFEWPGFTLKFPESLHANNCVRRFNHPQEKLNSFGGGSLLISSVFITMTFWWRDSREQLCDQNKPECVICCSAWTSWDEITKGAQQHLPLVSPDWVIELSGRVVSLTPDSQNRGCGPYVWLRLLTFVWEKNNLPMTWILLHPKYGSN